MTTEQYLHILQQELAALPYDEQKEALDYYRNYFDEAGEKKRTKSNGGIGQSAKIGSVYPFQFQLCTRTQK